MIMNKIFTILVFWVGLLCLGCDDDPQFPDPGFDMLTDKQRDVVELYYNEDLSLAEIAAHSGITRQGVRDSIKRAEGQLLEYEERLHLAARFRRIENVLSSIVEEAELIEKLNDRFGGAPEIDRSAQSIIRLAKQLDED